METAMAYVVKKLKYQDILDIPELNIKAGQLTCLTGPSGCGKTTFLLHLNGLLSPDEGDIFYFGESLTNFDPIELRREAVMMPQGGLVFPGTVKDNLVVGCRFASQSLPSDESLLLLLDRLSLAVSLVDSVAHLSGGEVLRLSLARILLMKPKVMLLDEPLSALDLSMASRVMEVICAQMQTEGKTVVMVTHQPQIVREKADAVIVMEGRGGHVRCN